MATLQDPNAEEARRLVSQHNDTVMQLLRDFVARHMGEFNAVQIYQRSDGLGWQVSGPLDKNGKQSHFVWIHLLRDRSSLHIHVDGNVERVRGGPFRELANAVASVLKIRTYVYPPRLFGRWDIVREGIEDAGQHLEVGIASLGASLGISTVAMTQLLGRSDYPLILLYALGCFAVSIPILTIVILMLFSTRVFSSMVLPLYRVTIALIGHIATFIGVALLFFYYHWVIGVIFIVFTIIALAVWMVYARGLMLVQEFWAEVAAPDDQTPVDA